MEVIDITRYTIDEKISIARNYLEKDICKAYGIKPEKALTHLSLSNTSLICCHKLLLLDLSWNHLVGSVPSWFGKFESLFYLDLSINSLQGEIPKSLTVLQSLISGNITIEEPDSSFQLSLAQQGGPTLTYRQISSFRPTLDLSYNNLQGPIWPDFWNLKRLHVLNLKENNLSGPIPNNLSGMRDLEKLDLSHNKLSGEIPVQW
ncbi:phytosulfokine receptor 1 [Quercus suber]|uniref:Phytosulfokine receptor 1 n=1 Tax=Quercus suber TaxID=58331 RepID=A0AAW0JTV4_QUESU